MDDADRRSEPRLPLGAQVTVALLQGAEWREFSGLTVNVSDQGLLVTLPEAPQVGELVRVKLPSPKGSWAEAVVRHVVRGTANSLVGIRLRGKHAP